MRMQNPSLILFLTSVLTSPGVGQESYLLEELTAERHVVAQGGYFPRLVVLPSGDLLATFKYGTAHVGKGGKAGIAKSKDGGRSWSTAETIFFMPDADNGVSATGQSPDGTIFFGLSSETWPGKIFTRKGDE